MSDSQNDNDNKNNREVTLPGTAVQEPLRPASPKGKLDAYRKAEVITANKETILLMMYAGAIRFLKKAILATEANNIQEKSHFIVRTQDIVSELRATLNFEAGGDIAANLEALYQFITEKLLEGNMNNKTAPLEEALKILVTLNDAWEQAIASLRKAPAAER